ncbi:uncharacterized protein LOC123918255 isoform X5 [Trifolium pratense]|uniref:uncharacterized protein LOC123918255 isoform X5 n=1 Tax=Trifolium pratense TaxID=57577 RepID=UPI001E6965F9|nr:uncharacterized protein LOC123918255 isoform X5 [Trifolium pratense]XP_045826255.1 uncharacterized protein LOC123918255 isoform X5 [Trifolium pratense]
MSIPFFSFVLLDSLSGRKLFIFVSPRLSICHRRLLLEFVCLVSNLFWLFDFLCDAVPGRTAWRFKGLILFVCLFHFKVLFFLGSIFNMLGIQTHFYMDRSISCFLCSL